MLSAIAKKAIEETRDAFKNEDPRRFYGLHLIAIIHEINNLTEQLNDLSSTIGHPIADLAGTLEETNASLRSLRIKLANGINVTAVPNGS